MPMNPNGMNPLATGTEHRPHTKTGQTHPARGPRPAANTRGRHPPTMPPATTQTHHITATATAQGETISMPYSEIGALKATQIYFEDLTEHDVP
ncbi:hypothetical protein ILYODFUR_010991 [Ilyodon furcidens]|uniref:Uncharacterized protein n=1 Tax=Ilyodon furcidens TaxID=33524 RepID=A0ABV0SWX5_9TELE